MAKAMYSVGDADFVFDGTRDEAVAVPGHCRVITQPAMRTFTPSRSSERSPALTTLIVRSCWWQCAVGCRPTITPVLDCREIAREALSTIRELGDEKTFPGPIRRHAFDQTRGFRLLVRLLTQMEQLSVDVVETARENLVIGQA
jgi:hypothetical protein